MTQQFLPADQYSLGRRMEDEGRKGGNEQSKEKVTWLSGSPPSHNESIVL